MATITPAVVTITDGDTTVTIDGSTYALVDIDTGPDVVETDAVTSPLVDGSWLVGMRRPSTTARLVIRAYGQDVTAMKAAVDALTAVVQGWSVEVTVTVGGDALASWVCLPGGVETGWNPVTMRAGWVDCSVTLTRQP